MHYSVLIYASEALTEQFSEEEDRQTVSVHEAFQERARRSGQLGPVARLMPTSAAVTLVPATSAGGKPLVLDGPFAETKEQLVGFYVLEASSLEEAIELAGQLPLSSGCFEVRPIQWFDSGVLP